MAVQSIEFWYEFASPYAYIAAERIDMLAGSVGLGVTWRPFVIGPILMRRPGNPSPTQDAPPAQKAYRRRDVERLCAREGIGLNWPTRYPRNGLQAARVALVAEPSWRADFSRAVYRANFVEDREIADFDVLADILLGLGQDADRVLTHSRTPENKAALAANVDEAVTRGIFGAPTFMVGDEIFWGNDRLEQALDWAARPWL